MADRFSFTKASLGTLLEDFQGRRLVHDDKQPGLVAELRSADVLTLYLYKRIEGRPTKIRLGRFPEITVELARTQCPAAGEDRRWRQPGR